jgi:hypothetical protein
MKVSDFCQNILSLIIKMDGPAEISWGDDVWGFSGWRWGVRGSASPDEGCGVSRARRIQAPIAATIGGDTALPRLW